ncbi:MAG: aminotransferase class I/II-fold pyridoxal phosphate-dependent enzyme, partial [Planctomycetota bacterium]
MTDHETSRRLRPFGTTIFSEMTALAQRHDAINLAQGFPDFDGPAELLTAAIEALKSGANQYSRSRGLPRLTAAIAGRHERLYGLRYDPENEVAVTCGATEGIAAALLGLLDPGDEVIFFEPFYDSYPACAAMAGATPRAATLRFPRFEIDWGELEGLFNERTRLLILNTPHNPTGKVFTREEMGRIAGLAIEHDVIVLSDEVYEHITFDGAEHVPMASISGMRERTLTLSSSGKTFSFTGWKIGWATGPASLVAALQAAHQFLTFCAATPLQLAVAEALETLPDAYYRRLRSEYEERRDLLLDALAAAGFEPAVPRGTYFILADFRRLSEGDDRAFAVELAE